MAHDLHRLTAAVQENCHISDSRHASDYTMCIYLLKMREYYRWEKGYSLSDRLPGDEVGDWLVEREALWESLEDQDYRPIDVDGRTIDPFDNDLINEALLPKELVYSGGLGRGCRPHFFLADLERVEEHDGYRILVSGKEYARDLTAPPAMALDKTIYVRQESFRRTIWERYEEWRWQKRESPMGRAIIHYDFDADPESSLDRMTAQEVNAVVLHEIGEIQAGQLLGSTWEDMLAALPRSRAEFMARAVRDHLADSLSTLPGLLEHQAEGSLHFYVANLNGMRKEIFPSLLSAYDDWHRQGKTRPLEQLVKTGRDHWQQLGEQMLDLYQQHGEGCGPRLESLIENNYL